MAVVATIEVLHNVCSEFRLSQNMLAKMPQTGVSADWTLCLVMTSVERRLASARSSSIRSGGQIRQSTPEMSPAGFPDHGRADSRTRATGAVGTGARQGVAGCRPSGRARTEPVEQVRFVAAPGSSAQRARTGPWTTTTLTRSECGDMSSTCSTKPSAGARRALRRG